MTYRDYIRNEYERRRAKNPLYSIRAYSKLLGMDSGAVSQILSGKRKISIKVMDRVVGVLELNTQQQEEFVRSVAEEKQRSNSQLAARRLKKVLKATTSIPTYPTPTREMTADEFIQVSAWHDFVVLEMTRQRDFSSKSVARKLGIPQADVVAAIERLRRVGLIKISDGRWQKTNVIADTLDKTKSTEAHRRRQEAVLKHSLKSLQSDPVSIRNHSGVTLCLNPEKIPVIKAKIQDFLWKLADELYETDPKVAYEISLQMFPWENGVKTA